MPHAMLVEKGDLQLEAFTPVLRKMFQGLPVSTDDISALNNSGTLEFTLEARE